METGEFIEDIHREREREREIGLPLPFVIFVVRYRALVSVHSAKTPRKVRKKGIKLTPGMP